MKHPIMIEEPQRVQTTPREFALWNLGFRPFYLLASAFASVSIALWAMQVTGWLGQAYLQGPMWHAHEMLFGFMLAVIVGFLFTAGGNWSGRTVVTGKPLAAMAALWVAGRVLVLTPFGWTAAIANAAFPLVAAVYLAIAFVAAGNRRNYFFVGLLVMLAIADFAVHLGHLRVLEFPGWLGIQLALDIVLFILAVMGGRVIPMFTNNGVAGARASRHPWVETASLGLLLALVAADAAQLHGAWFAGLAGACALAHAARWLLWQPWKTFRAPLVWILHVAYAWIPVHLALRALSEAAWVAPSLATHALTTGAAGGLIIGMMTRTARGHTGRPLKADRLDVACYALITAAAAVRVLVPLALPGLATGALIGSAALWSSGFALYVLGYWPVLVRARVDGKAG